MLDMPARVWERAGEVFLAPPVPCPPFIRALKHAVPRASYNGSGWVLSTLHADAAVALLYQFFPVVQDGRPIPAPVPPFADGASGDPFAHLDLIPLLQPVAPALLAIFDDRHAARQAFTQVAAHDPAVPTSLGFMEGYEGRWVISYAAQRFWAEWLAGLADNVTSQVQPDSTLLEQITAQTIQTVWLQTRVRVCGDLPTHLGQRWYPPQQTLPFWVAALLACIDRPGFLRDPDGQTLMRTLAPWPLRRLDQLHRIDLKDAAHWQLSLCVLPHDQSRDGQDSLLHLSAVNGVSKNRALWAAILDGRREPIAVKAGRQRYYARRMPGRHQYMTDWNETPLHASGLSHMALTHRTAFEPELGQAFVHLVGNDLASAPDLALFAQQLSRALSMPFDLAWASQLWEYGCQEDDGGTALITPLPSTGCQGYWVRADEECWTRMIVAIQQGRDPAQLAETDVAVTEIGADPVLLELAEQAGEGDAETADDADMLDDQT